MDVRGKNLLPAKEFGEMEILLTGEETNEQVITKLHEKLQSISKKDFVLLIGHPLFIAMTAAVAFEYEDTINFLIWDREHYKYNVESIHI